MSCNQRSWRERRLSLGDTVYEGASPQSLLVLFTFTRSINLQPDTPPPSIGLVKDKAAMFFTSFLLLTSSLASASGIERRTIISSPSATERESTPLAPASNTLTLTRQKSPKGYNARSAAFLLNKTKKSPYPTGPATTGLVSLEIGEEFATNITFGEQTFQTIVDTGSSDTWAVATGFQCLNITTGELISEDDCFFGPTFTQDSTFTQIPNQNLNLTYGDGEYITGIMGYEDVTLAGVKVRQEVSLIQNAAWEGDDTTSGLTGFAYPSM